MSALVTCTFSVPRMASASRLNTRRGRNTPWSFALMIVVDIGEFLHLGTVSPSCLLAKVKGAASRQASTRLLLRNL